jgi:hypothetical protein
MNKKKAGLAVFIILLLMAAFGVWLRRSVPGTVHLNLTGTPGLKIAGTLSADGVAREFSGVLPTNITVEARAFEYTIMMQAPLGELRGELTVGGGPSGSSSTANEFSGVKGQFSRTWRGESVMMTTARKGDPR